MEATDHLNKNNEIGSGGFGRVFIGNNLRCTGTTVAIKVLTRVCNFNEYFFPLDSCIYMFIFLARE